MKCVKGWRNLDSKRGAHANLARLKRELIKILTECITHECVNKTKQMNDTKCLGKFTFSVTPESRVSVCWSTHVH